MKFSKYHNPNKKKHHHKMSRTDADIMAVSRALDLEKLGYKISLETCDKISDKLCGLPSRNIVHKEEA